MGKKIKTEILGVKKEQGSHYMEQGDCATSQIPTRHHYNSERVQRRKRENTDLKSNEAQKQEGERKEKSNGDEMRDSDGNVGPYEENQVSPGGRNLPAATSQTVIYQRHFILTSPLNYA